MSNNFLCVGFNPTAAIMTWKLSTQTNFKTYTYWPTHTVRFNTELYGSATYQPNQLDLSNISPANKPSFDVILMVITSIKDVSRICKKIAPVITKNTVILVEASGGVGNLQRLVRPNFPKNVVSGVICDLNTRLLMDRQSGVWHVQQYGDEQTIGPKPAVHIEASSSKNATIAALEAAFNRSGLKAPHPKNQAAFSAIQWERAISVVAFEIVSVVMEVPTVENLLQNVVAKPIIEGVISEMLGVASAAGVKSLPSRAQFMKQAFSLVRRAPKSFEVPGATRMFYEFFEHIVAPIDFLLLLPILQSDDLSKGVPTPYLESLYAIMSRLSEINQADGSSSSLLFVRKDLIANAEIKTTSPESSVQSLARGPSAAITEKERQLADRERELDQRSATFEQMEQSLRQREASIEQSNQSFASRDVALRANENSVQAREEALSNKETAVFRREQTLAQREQQIRALEQQLKQSQEQRDLDTRQGPPVVPVPNQTRERVRTPSYGGNGGAGIPTPAMKPNGFQPPSNGVPAPLNGNSSMPPPRKSRSQPGLNVAPFANQEPPMPINDPTSPVPNSGHPLAKRRGQSMLSMSEAMNRAQINGPANGNQSFQGAPGQGPPYGPPRSGSRPPSRRSYGAPPGGAPQNQTFSPNPENFDMMAMTGRRGRNGSRSGQPTMTSMTSAYGGGSFSQTFQLDGIMGLAGADRYQLAGRSNNAHRLSADHSFSSSRPFAHGLSSPPGNVKSPVADRRNSMQFGLGSAPSMPTVEVNDFKNFNFSSDSGPYSGSSKRASSSSPRGSGSLSGNSRSTPPQSPSVTPPTPHTLDPNVTDGQKLNHLSTDRLAELNYQL